MCIRDRETIAGDIEKVISGLVHSFSVGNVLKNGIPVAIVGETNAGKSTLLNTLLNEEKAIVSDIHGTTRAVSYTHLDVYKRQQYRGDMGGQGSRGAGTTKATSRTERAQGGQEAEGLRVCHRQPQHLHLVERFQISGST